MSYDTLRQELRAFYWNDNNAEPARAFANKCFAILDRAVTPDMSVSAQKQLQQQVILEQFTPVLFPHLPFYCETGTMTSLCDGSRRAKGSNFIHAGGWVYQRNEDRFRTQDLQLWDKLLAQKSELLYLIPGGPYNDVTQHFNFNNRPILKGGLRSLYQQAQQALPSAQNAEETEFLQAVMDSMLQLKQAANKFSSAAEQMLTATQDTEERANLSYIRDTAKRIPWEAPKTFCEALCALAFMRKLLGALEGIGPNTFGRLDVDLYPFYENDLREGRLTPDSAYDLICKFLLLWDCHYDHAMPMVSYADHELENTYTLGGCDVHGVPVYNDLTRMFLQATRDETIIFPKIKCRFSANSPKEYLDEINKAVIRGNASILFQNDDATIPAIVRSGRPVDEARDYMVSGCWGMASYGTEKFDHACYLNLLKPFEFAVHRLYEKMEKVSLTFETYDDADSFQTFYDITLRNCQKLLAERIAVTRKGAHVWHTVDSLPIFSATMEGWLDRKRDFTYAGGKYRDDYLLCFGLPNLVDSLMAVKSLVYDQKKYTLEQYLTAVRSNWVGQEHMRAEAIRCSGWGDGQAESSTLAARLHNDLYTYAQSLEGTYGGKVHLGHLTYTEIRWWGEKTLATPDGRRSGDYFSQGLTPSRLKRISSVTDVIRSMQALDASTMAANSVVNIILPSDKITLDSCEGFLRAVAGSAVMCLQLNCTTREQLLDAQKHPEKYPELIVRVCGFSARFTSLSPEWQQEILTRNFYE